MSSWLLVGRYIGEGAVQKHEAAGHLASTAGSRERGPLLSSSSIVLCTGRLHGLVPCTFRESRLELSLSLETLLKTRLGGFKSQHIDIKINHSEGLSVRDCLSVLLL